MIVIGISAFFHDSAACIVVEGKVIAAGPGARKENGERIAMDVSVGDTVLYAKYSGTNIKLQGKEYLILKETDVLAIVLNGKA